MRLTKKEKIQELATLKKHNVLMTDDDYKELKLGQLEDIEEELGIDLITFFKALKDGVYMKTKNIGLVEDKHPRLVHYKNGWRILVCGSIFQLKTYGINWILKKEKL